MRRWARPPRLLAAFAAAMALLVVVPPAIAQDATAEHVRDIGPMVGFRQNESSYSLAVADVNGDGWPDLLIDHHGERPAELFQNQPNGHGGTWGFQVVHQLVDTIHDRPDRHGCIIGDPNQDGLLDFLCEKGGQQGYGKKWNELWIQGPKGTWTDEAKHWGVQDIWGRGRFPAWIDLNHDRWPDLFLGNDIPDRNGHTTPDRTYINVHGDHYKQVFMGVTQQIGDFCSQAADVNGDGWDDLLVCGRHQLYLFIRQGNHFVNEAAAYGVPQTPYALDAKLVDLNGDGHLDLVVAQWRHLIVQLGEPGGHFGPPVVDREMSHGHGIVVGDLDGMNGPDILAINGCYKGKNMNDVLLLNDGTATQWTQVPVPPVHDGCGDTGIAFDFDKDGKDDFVVLNGGGPSQSLALDGPDQLLTMGSWQPPG